MSTGDREIEQTYLNQLYQRLDHLRGQATERLATALATVTTSHQARSERDAITSLYGDQIAQFGAVENGLCFGRLDFVSGEHCHIGRIGLFDEEGDYEPLLIDWRAPAARPFYLATPVNPGEVRRRRHIRTRFREVVALDDEVLDLEAVAETRPDSPVGESALLAALTASRTGRMADIVQTIQAEQDHIIRASQQGVLVVQGGPGTGKTAVALHRAAYLLYTYRQELAQRGVLIVGPNPTFLRYIGQVLPSLGETGVLLSTVGQLFPGINARRVESVAAATVKGRAGMADVLAAAVADRQWVPEGGLDVDIDRDILHLDAETCRAARVQARETLLPHNQARATFVTEVIEALTRQEADRIGKDLYKDEIALIAGEEDFGDNVLDPADLAEIRRELATHPKVQAALTALWPVLTPRQLLSELYAAPERLATAAPDLTPEERALLHRDPAPGWTPADVPLLDEAAELLGEDEDAAAELADRQRRTRALYAQGVLDVTEGSRPIDLEDEDDPEILMAYDLLDADELAERYSDVTLLSVAERAAADRSWRFGHVIVDEAQELSAMTWRVLMRRCPSRSMTVVGDVAQTGDPAGSTSWQDVFGPYVARRWREAVLTVNYRTPAEIAEVAADVLAALDPALSAPTPVRASGIPPWHAELDLAGLPALVRTEAASLGEGRLAVIVPEDRVAEFAAAVEVAADADLERPVVVLSVRQAKGLEFDGVLLVEPAEILAESARGLSDLYVALTRATRQLGVLHTGELPAVLGRLRPAA